MLVDSLELIDQSKIELAPKNENQISRTQSRERFKEPTSMSFKENDQFMHPQVKDKIQRSRSV